MRSLTIPKRTVSTAVIPVGGLGTRMLPFTAGEPKFMVPIYAGDAARPNIDYVLDDCISAGITHIIFVTRDGGDKHLKRYLSPLKKSGIAPYLILHKQKELRMEQARRARSANIRFTYIKQHGKKFGTAIPLSLARKALKGDDYFLVTGGDDFIWSPDGESESRKQIQAWQQSEAEHSVMGKSVPRAEGSKYGILQLDANAHLVQIDEKPPQERIPMDPALANISRYILSQKIWPHVNKLLAQKPTVQQPEYFITDVVNSAASSGLTFCVHTVEGLYFDAGSPKGAREASKTISDHLDRVHQ